MINRFHQIGRRIKIVFRQPVPLWGLPTAGAEFHEDADDPNATKPAKGEATMQIMEREKIMCKMRATARRTGPYGYSPIAHSKTTMPTDQRSLFAP